VEEALLEVVEPSVCVYNMVFSTPLACDDSLVKGLTRRIEEAKRLGALIEDNDSTSLKEEL